MGWGVLGYGPNTTGLRVAGGMPGKPKRIRGCYRGQSIWTHPYWPQPAHSHWQHSPTRAQLKGSSCSSSISSQTRGMPFRAQLEECYVLNPILSSTQGIRSELNSRNPAILPLKHHQKSRRSRLQSPTTRTYNSQIA